MAAAILQSRRFAVFAEKQHDVLAEQAERLGAVLEVFEGDHRVPEAAQDPLFGG